MTVRKNIDEILVKYQFSYGFENTHVNSPLTQGSDGDTPFHLAAFDGAYDDVMIMLKLLKKHEVNLKGDIGNTALHYAVMNNHDSVAALLISHGANVNQKNDYGDRPADKILNNKNLFKKSLKLMKAAV